MDRVFTSGASATPPSPPASPSSGYATAGNPGVPTAPTEPGPWWFHMMTEEVRAVIVAAGLTPNHEDVTQLSQAILAMFANIATPPQFDNDTSIATTAFVQRALGNFQSSASITVNTVLTIDALGKVIYVGGTATQITIPDGTSAPAGGTLTIHNVKGAGGDVTVVPSAGDVFSADGGSISSLVIKPGDSATFYRVHSDIWYVLGTATLQHSYSFAKSLGVSGYQKFPGGLIAQWGIYTFSASNSVAVTFPISFPNVIFIGAPFNPNTSNLVTSTALTISGMTIVAATPISASGYWIALGR